MGESKQRYAEREGERGRVGGTSLNQSACFAEAWTDTQHFITRTCSLTAGSDGCLNLYHIYSGCSTRFTLLILYYFLIPTLILSNSSNQTAQQSEGRWSQRLTNGSSALESEFCGRFFNFLLENLFKILIIVETGCGLAPLSNPKRNSLHYVKNNLSRIEKEKKLKIVNLVVW